MKVISLLQPWATLVVLGAKRIETRSWNTKHTGPLLVHASKGKSKLARDVWRLAHYHHLIDIPPYDLLPFGAIIGQVQVDGTQKTSIIEGVATNGIWYHQGSLIRWEQEKDFGDYRLGRYGWLLSNPQQFADPIPAKGNLLLWDYDLQSTLKPSGV